MTLCLICRTREADLEFSSIEDPVCTSCVIETANRVLAEPEFISARWQLPERTHDAALDATLASFVSDLEQDGMADDPATRHDIAVAFLDMGLVREAVIQISRAIVAGADRQRLLTAATIFFSTRMPPLFKRPKAKEYVQ